MVKNITKTNIKYITLSSARIERYNIPAYVNNNLTKDILLQTYNEVVYVIIKASRATRYQLAPINVPNVPPSRSPEMPITKY